MDVNSDFLLQNYFVRLPFEQQERRMPLLFKQARLELYICIYL